LGDLALSEFRGGTDPKPDLSEEGRVDFGQVTAWELNDSRLSRSVTPKRPVFWA
jgi:hypothetical protein